MIEIEAELRDVTRRSNTPSGNPVLNLVTNAGVYPTAPDSDAVHHVPDSATFPTPVTLVLDGPPHRGPRVIGVKSPLPPHKRGPR